MAAVHATSSASRMRPDIEGMRAIAVGTVLAYHAGVPKLTGGFAGVDVFFVISGFLITSLLVREADRSGRISILEFYARRARRLLPAASLVLIVTAVAGRFLLPQNQHANLASDVLAATLYVVNWALAFRAVDYLAEDAAVSPVQHYWSLSVEEQFYVVWPLLMIVGIVAAKAWGWSFRRLLFGLLLLTAGASLVYSILHTRSDPATAYFYTTTRVWELAIGALLAFAVNRLSRMSVSTAQALSGIGLTAVVVSMFVITERTPWPGYAALLPTLGTGAVLAAGCATQDTIAARILGLRPMVWIGGLSYAIYLWHWPLLVLALSARPDLRLRHKLAIAAGSIVLAWLTKHLVENPIRFAPSLAKSAVRSVSGGLVVMGLSAGVALVSTATLPRLDPNAQVAGALALVADAHAETFALRSDVETTYDTSGDLAPPPALATEDLPLYYEQGCHIVAGASQPNLDCSYGDKRSSTVVALVGDSKMGQWFSAFDAIARQEHWRLDLYSKSACPFTYSGVKEAECAQFGRNVVAAMRDPDHTPDVVISSTGKSDSAALRAGMAAAFADVEALGAKVVLMADNTAPSRGLLYECLVRHPDDYLACAFRPARGNAALTAALATALDAPVLDLNTWICPTPKARCPAAIGGVVVFRQGSHLTNTYVRTLTPMVHRELIRIGLSTMPLSRVGSNIPNG